MAIINNIKTMFLPNNAKEPKTKKNYTMPLEEGQHKLRVLSSAIIGYEGWDENGGKKTPVRYKMGEEPQLDPNGKEPKYFWAFIVWNYDQERVQIMQLTQKTIRTAFEAYVNNEAWGNPQEYDLVITRRGMKMDDTEYSVVANPKTELAEEIKTAHRKANVNLNALWTNDDPFDVDSPKTAETAPEQPSEDKKTIVDADLEEGSEGLGESEIDVKNIPFG